MRHQPTDLFTCARCSAPPAGVVSVAELDEGRAARAVAEVALCVEHLGGVALAARIRGARGRANAAGRGGGGMKRKPTGAKYRNLYARGEVIYFERVVGGKREKRSTHTADWDEAADARDCYLQRRAQERAGAREATFATLAERYLREATGHLAASTREDREKLLGPEKRLRLYFGAMRVAQVTRATLIEWWHREVEARGRSEKTGLQYLAALAGVFGYAVDLELLEANPVDGLRGTLRRRRRTKRGRSAAAATAHIHPLETPEELRAFVAASGAVYDSGERERRLFHVADLLQLDAGLREGEAAGLRWRDVVWGHDASDTARALLVREAIARGKHQGPPKSGRERVVALSARLRGLLREFYIASGRSDPAERVLAGFLLYRYQTQHFEAVCAKAGIQRHTPKDLRDTFASQLLTAGIQLAYISEQLGHADVATTARHYARWVGGKAYRRPLELGPGEVPADFLARIEALDSHQKSHHPHLAGAS